MMDDEASSKEVEDLISEVDELSFNQDEKAEKKKEKKKKSSKSKSKGLVPPNMGPPPSMGPPMSAPGKLAPPSGSLGGGRHSLDSTKGAPQDDMCVLEDADDFNSPVKAPQPKSVDIRPANGGQSPTQAKNSDSGDFGSAGALGGQSQQSRARVLAQQRELQNKRRQQAMSGNNAMLRSTEELGPNHTPAMRQFGPRDSADDPYNKSGRSDGVSDSQEFNGNQRPPASSARSSYDSAPPTSPGAGGPGPVGGRRPPGPAPTSFGDTRQPGPYEAPYDSPDFGYDAYPNRAAPMRATAPPESSFEEQDPYAYAQNTSSVYVSNSPTRSQEPQGYGAPPGGPPVGGPTPYGEPGYDRYGGGYGGGGGYGRGGYDDRGYGRGGYDDRGYGGPSPYGGYDRAPMGRGDGYDRPVDGSYDGRPMPRDGPGYGDGYGGPGYNRAPMGRGDGYDRPVDGSYDGRPMPRDGPGYDPRAPQGPRGYGDPYMGRGGPGYGGDMRDPYQAPMGRGEPAPYDQRDAPKFQHQAPEPSGRGPYDQQERGPQANQRQEQPPMAVEQAPEVVPQLAERVETGLQAEEEKPFDIRSLKLDDTSNLRNFLMNPTPKEAKTIQCYIKRDKSTFRKMFPEYRVYMKIPTANGSERDLFLMCGKKRSGQKTSNYLISMSEDDLRRTSHNYLGKLRANFVGTEFKIYDNGSNPEDVDNDDTESSSSARQELGVVQYESNVMGSRGPRRMQVGLPRVQEDGSLPLMTTKESMMSKFKKRDFTQMVVAYNKPPRWNETVGAFVLNFNGRVTMASVKNFQLITHDDQDQVILQFGRISKAEFTMDFSYPMTPFQAFAITLSSFDSKIACD